MSTGDTEAFAQRLREMREASGRSYGALARRVGVSASTLHRYCSGHTVPMEFAPVERLARLCGCRGDDLVALHRLWVLADAERTRRQLAAQGTPGPAQGTPGPESDGRPLADTTHTVPAPVDGLDGSTPAKEPSASGPSDERSVNEDTAAPDAPSAEDPPEVTVVLGARRPRRHHRAVYASVAVVLTTVSLVLLLAFDRAPFSRADRQRTTVEQPDGTRTGQASAATPDGRPSVATVPPSPSASASVPSSGASRRGPSTEGTGVSGSPTTTPSRRTTAPATPGGLPFSWTLDQHVWKNECDHAYLVDRTPSRVPPPPSESDAAPWAGSLGAVHGGETMVRIAVQGKTDRAVVLQALRVRTVARRTPPQDNVYLMNVGCGGSLTPRMFDVNLDAPRPTARSVAGSDAGVEIPAVSFPYRVSATDPEVLLVTGRAVDCDCDWYLELEWTSGSDAGTVRIDDRGRPFRTSGIKGRPTYEYDTIEGTWRRVSVEGRGGTEGPSQP
ncbi:helix-turn-helix domain-containing protein [Streptomyces sp. NPDC005963]|uniref:transcriptional regulator n=1 Tax=Streptomyces sp. NPDC005963 TaxID=3156721 RepID=UPI0033D6D689